MSESNRPPTDHRLPPGQPIPLTGTAFHLFPRGDGAFEELLASNATLIEAELQAVGGLAEGTKSGAPSVGMLVRAPDGQQYLVQTTLRLFLTAADALRAVHGDPRT